MAKNREMLKEAIAEAKAVKEAAIANAKAALEEAFTPQLKSMLSLKLHEMEMEEDEDIKEYAELQPDRDMDGDGDVDADDVKMMEVDLEELLAELELEEGEDDTLNEAEEEGEEEGEEEEGEEEGDMEMEDLSDDEIKEMIEDVIAQMIKDGELEAGPEFGGEEEGEEMEMGAEEEEEEVDLAELLREIEEMEEPVDEISLGGLFKTRGIASYLTDEKGLDKNKAKELASKFENNPNDESARQEILKYIKQEDYKDLAGYLSKDFEAKRVTSILGPLNAALKGVEYIEPKLASGGSSPTSRALGETDEMKKELEEAYKTINTLRSELNEINLLNAKLLYSNKIFKAKNLNENQKVKVLSSFDKAKNVGEVKMVYETLNEGIKVKKETIKENLGRASKSTVTPTAKQPIVESNDVFKRMQKLAGII